MVGAYEQGEVDSARIAVVKTGVFTLRLTISCKFTNEASRREERSSCTDRRSWDSSANTKPQCKLCYPWTTFSRSPSNRFRPHLLAAACASTQYAVGHGRPVQQTRQVWQQLTCRGRTAGTAGSLRPFEASNSKMSFSLSSCSCLRPVSTVLQSTPPKRR